MTSSSNRSRARRPLAGERRLTGQQRGAREERLVQEHRVAAREQSLAGEKRLAREKRLAGEKRVATEQARAGHKPLGTEKDPAGEKGPAAEKRLAKQDLAAAKQPAGEQTHVVPSGSGTAATSRSGPGWVVAGVALLLAMACLATSLFLWRGADEHQASAADRLAASAAASRVTEQLLSYDYKTFDQHTGAVSAQLTGSFRNEFVQAASTVVKPLAVQNHAVVVAKVSKASVMSTPGQDDIKILLFVDQRTTSTKLARPQIDQNRVMLTMSAVDGRWLVSKIEAF